MDAMRAICERHTVFLRREAIEAGYDDRMLRDGVRRGLLHRVRTGAYLFTDTWASLDARERHLARTRAVLRTARHEGVLSHATAAMVHGAPTWGLDLDHVHLTRIDGPPSGRLTGVRQHAGKVRASEREVVGDFEVTTPVRTAFDVSAVSDVEHALPLVNDLLHRRLVTVQSLRDIARTHGHSPGAISTRVVFGLADHRIESVGESLAYFMFWRQGLPAPVPQHEVRDATGAVIARVDFAWPELGVYVEFDGDEKYHRYRREGESVTEMVLREKKREDRINRATGWRCIRICWADLHRPTVTCREITAAMKRRTA